MRRALVIPLALAAALAACHVDVEGAKCDVVGATDQCPSGQKCGTDWTCSVRAASCTPCVADATAHCAVGATDFLLCSAAGDPACGKTTVTKSCVATSQTCQVPQAGGDPDCACTTWTVVPGGNTDVCTRSAIATAITEAMKFPRPKVVLGGVTSTTYGNELADLAPIVIPAGLALIGDNESLAAATNQTIVVYGPSPEGLQVHAGASVKGVAVQRAAGGPMVGVLLPDGSAVALGNTLVSVRVDAGGAGGAFATGLRIAGGNAVAVKDVLVKGATVAGLEVNRVGPTDAVVVSESTFDGNQVGVSLLKGDLTLEATAVGHSKAEGIRANSRSGSSLSVQGGKVYQGGSIGLVLEANDRLRLEGVRICGNAGAVQTVLGTPRTVGGVYTLDAPPAVQVFQGNFIHNNGGDQLLFGASATGTWNISAASCAAGSNSNVVAGYVATVGVGVSAIGADVDARNVAWKTVSPPSMGVDFFTASSGNVNARGSGGEFCQPVTPPACPP